MKKNSLIFALVFMISMFFMGTLSYGDFTITTNIYKNSGTITFVSTSSNDIKTNFRMSNKTWLKDGTAPQVYFVTMITNSAYGNTNYSQPQVMVSQMGKSNILVRVARSESGYAGRIAQYVKFVVYYFKPHSIIK
jgi:hypothetical protein